MCLLKCSKACDRIILISRPIDARKAMSVIICTIGVDGKASDFGVELMTNPAFAYEAVRAIQKWRWAPALKDGHPVAQKVRVPMHFNVL